MQLPHEMRTFNVDVRTGDDNDWSATFPWRSPGSSQVFGSGCGVLGGNAVPLPNGGMADPRYQGMDGLDLPRLPVSSTVWPVGSIQEVAFGLTANHGGGYSWRLCPLDQGQVSEECFQKHVLRFYGDTHEIRHDNRTFQYDKMFKPDAYHIPRQTTTEGTNPAGSEWARVPIPACRLCDQFICGPGLYPNLTDMFCTPQLGLLGHKGDCALGGLQWFEQQMCAQSCSGINLTACPPGMLQFDEPANGLSGYTSTVDQHEGLPYSIVDRVQVPTDLPTGDYLLSWRWDAEQSHQVWQNCADLRITESEWP